jgi:SAM-dependent methyltransferase
MNRELWESWAGERAEALAAEPWLLSKWETCRGLVWPEEKIQLMVEDIRGKLELSPGQRLLDLACGSGWIGQRLQSYVRETTAIDFSSAMLVADTQSGIMRVKADAGFLPLASDSFDRILIYFTLLNFTDRNQILTVLRESLRVLAIGGKLLIGQMPLASRSQTYDREKQRYLDYCRSCFAVGEDLATDHAPPIVLFEDDYSRILEQELAMPIKVFSSFNHFWRRGEPGQCSWRVDYLLEKAEP